MVQTPPRKRRVGGGERGKAPATNDGHPLSSRVLLLRLSWKTTNRVARAEDAYRQAGSSPVAPLGTHTHTLTCNFFFSFKLMMVWNSRSSICLFIFCSLV